MIETLGQRIKKERERNNLTIEQVVKATHIRSQYIEAIESDKLDLLPTNQSRQGFLRLYINFLGLDPDLLITSQSDNIIPEHNGVEIQVDQDIIENHTELIDSMDDFSTDKGENLVEDDKNADSIIPAVKSQNISLSDSIFQLIGDQLRRQREILGFSFDEVEKHIHVRKHYLEALEKGDLDHLPSSVQARGMLSNYAYFLDMDIEALLLSFAEGLQAKHQENKPVVDSEYNEKKDKLSPKILRSLLSFDVIIGGGLIILLISFAIWGTIQVLSSQSTPPSMSTLSISAALLESPQPLLNDNTPTPTSTVIPILPTISGSPPSLPTGLPGRVQVIAVIIHRAWMRVIVDGELKFEGRALPGTTYTFSANQRIEILSSNGSAVQIIYNQNDLGVMGNFGEIAYRFYTDSGVIIPSPTITPSPTRTQLATPASRRTTDPSITSTNLP